MSEGDQGGGVFLFDTEYHDYTDPAPSGLRWGRGGIFKYTWTLHRPAFVLTTPMLTTFAYSVHTHKCKDAVSNLIKNRKQPKPC